MKFEKGSKGEIRRKLVGGSVAAPLLLTLRPGTAAAASATACIAKSANANWPVWQENAGADQAYRLPVRIYSVKLKDSAPAAQKGPFECYKDGSNYKLKNNGIAGSAGSIFANDIDGQLEFATDTGDDDYALVYVDPATGQVLGRYPEVTFGSAISYSCWSSIVPSIA